MKQYETDESYNNYEMASKIGYDDRKYSKYFVQQDVLKDKYDTVSEAQIPFLKLK